MTTIADIVWGTMKDHYRTIVETICHEYETNPKYHIKKVIENGELVGFGVYYDTLDCRVMEAGYYTGTDPRAFFRLWRWGTKGIKILRAVVQKPNKRMVDWYRHMKFAEIAEDMNNIVFEKRRA